MYENDENVIELRKLGLGCSEISKRLNLSRYTVYDIIKRLDNGGGKYKVKLKRITELREQNKTYQEIADELGMTHDQIELFCRNHDLKYSEEEKQIAQHKRALELCGWNKGKVKADWEKNIKEKYGEQFELISMSETDVNGNRTLVIRCSTCGTEKIISSISTRGKTKRRCLVCFPADRTNSSNVIRSHAQSENTKRIKSLEKRLKTEKKRNKKKLKENQVAIKFCEECNLVIVPSNRRVCDECKRKTSRAIEDRKATKRRLKIKESKFDSDITVEETFKRYNGICYLCGKLCDWNDYKIIKGNKVVGGSYPTREHVIALCNGGTHTWDNVKLACHACNSKKGRKLLAG